LGFICNLDLNLTLFKFARFRLSDAILNGKIHSYILEKMLPVQNLLPIYGNISAQIFVLIIIFLYLLSYIQVQPISLVTPLAQGYLDIFIPNEGKFLKSK